MSTALGLCQRIARLTAEARQLCTESPLDLNRLQECLHDSDALLRQLPQPQAEDSADYLQQCAELLHTANTDRKACIAELEHQKITLIAGNAEQTRATAAIRRYQHTDPAAGRFVDRSR